ncbi:MAG: tetratricopeptide repeat protein [Alphaproteobacteria bacterium]|nr:tetratricopeptide repeat protein [Alphaproteobacteria bacterium]MBU2378413.1 tetratricopeptide repeat protein [Alphaproteobacteria bacterium]
MRHASLRSLLIAATALVAAPVLAQDEPPAVPPASPEVAPETPATRPLIVIGPEAETPAPTIEAIPAVWAPVPRDDQDRSAYGLYLSARLALSRGEAEAGAAYLTAVEALTPEQPRIQDQAFTAALLAGDLGVAARIVPEASDASPVITQAGALVSAVQTFVAGDAAAANAALKAHPIGAPHARAGALIAPWIAAAAGDWTTALAEPNPTGDPIILLFGRFHRALLLEHRRQYPEAEAALRVLAEDARTAPLFRTSYGEFLERRGRRDEALAFYDAAIADGAEDVAIARARARVVARGRAPALPDYREGVAKALTAAAAQASAESANEFAVVYLRLSLNLHPEPETRYLLGQTLSQAGLDAAARSVLAGISDDNAVIYAAAQVQLGLSQSKAENYEAALAAFQTARAATPADGRIAYLVASQLLQMERYEEALELLNGPQLNFADQSADIRFMRGAAYESLGRIPEAEAELWAALQVKPNDPNFLNYLGYLWVDSGTRVPEGAEMIARAHAAEPGNGNIQDSLGWSQYRQGQYETAVDTLEQAVAKQPANAEINDHLGDAYWQVGRRREAGFQWNRVLTLDPDAERRAEVERKLVDGLDAPQPVGGGEL